MIPYTVLHRNLHDIKTRNKMENEKIEIKIKCLYHQKRFSYLVVKMCEIIVENEKIILIVI